jgi:predicted DsbA family dithiol-disulfide isomerase
MNLCKLVLIAGVMIVMIDIGCAVQPKGQKRETKLPDGQKELVATFDGESISSAKLEELVGEKLLRLKTEEYLLRRATLDEHIDSLLLSREASKRKTTVKKLLQQEVTDRIQPVNVTEAQAVVANAPENFSSMTKEEAVKVVMDHLQRKRTTMRRTEFLTSLRAAYSYTMLLDPPRLTQQFADGPSVGPKDATVSIIEFSDFQCPACIQLKPTLDRLRQEYANQVRLTFKQFPLPMHRQAAKAADAALCAAEQNRFWEMHDVLFANQDLLKQEQFTELARRAGLNQTAFKSCFNSNRTTHRRIKEVFEGRSADISSTPTLFINGRMITGARPYESLREIIEEELKRVAPSSSGTPAIITERR